MRNISEQDLSSINSNVKIVDYMNDFEDEVKRKDEEKKALAFGRNILYKIYKQKQGNVTFVDLVIHLVIECVKYGRRLERQDMAKHCSRK